MFLLVHETQAQTHSLVFVLVTLALNWSPISSLKAISAPATKLIVILKENAGKVDHVESF